MSKNNNVGSLPLSTTVVTRFLLFCAVLLALPAVARAVPLPTGDTALSGTTLAQRPELAYEVVEDHLIPYSFQGAESSVSGVIQNRVFRSVVDGTLNFYWRIIPDASSTGDITAFRVGGFDGFALDGDFHLDSPGSVGPDTARNFGDGSVNFLFSDGVSAGESSFFFFLDTQATAFSNTGNYDLLCADNGCISPLFTTFAPALETSLVTKQVTVWLAILQRNNIPLENLTVSTLLSEDVLATGETTANVTVADVNKGQIAFVSNIDGNPFIISYIPASDIQNGTTSIRLGSIADGFIMSNPLMFGFRDSDRQAILSYAKNVPLYQALKQEINTALQTDPYKLLRGKNFPKIYEDATLLIIDAAKNIGGEALAQKVVKEALNITRDAIIGQTDVPYLNDLGQRKIEAVNPTMVFYGFNVAELPGLARVIAGKESWWGFGSLQFTDPVKESIDLGGDGQFNITFSKTGTDAAGKGAAAANLLKIECILLDVVFWCPATNKTIESSVEKLNDQTLASLSQDIWGDPGDPRAFKKVIETALKLLTKPGLNLWPEITRIIYENANTVDKEAAIKFLQKNAKYLKAAKVVFKILTAYNAVNVYLPFIWDGVTKPNNVKYCVTEAKDLSQNNFSDFTSHKALCSWQ